MKRQEPAGGFAIQDAARLRFFNPWDAAGLKVEAIGNLIARGELPFSFVDVPVMAVLSDRMVATVFDQLTSYRVNWRARGLNGGRENRRTV